MSRERQANRKKKRTAHTRRKAIGNIIIMFFEDMIMELVIDLGDVINKLCDQF